jgi:hypothetical protein
MTDPTIVTSYEYDTNKITMMNDNFFFSVGFYSYLDGSKLELSNSTNNYTSLLNTSDIQLSCNDCGFNISKRYYEEYYNKTLVSGSNITSNETIADSNSTNTTTGRRMLTTDNTTVTNNSTSNASTIDVNSNSSTSETYVTNSTGWRKPTAFLAKSLLEKQLENYSQKNISNSSFYLVNCNNSIFSDSMRIKTISKSRSQDIAEIMRTYSFCFPKVFKADLSDGSDSGYDQTLSAQLEYKNVEYIPDELKSAFTLYGAVDPSNGR